MSCVIGLVTKDKVLMAGDSSASDGNVIIQNDFPKISIYDSPIKKIKIAIGLVGAYLPNQVVHFFFEPPKDQEAHDFIAHNGVDGYIVKMVMPSMRNLLVEQAAYNPRSEDYITGLIGMMGNLYFVDNSLGVLKSRFGYEAIGSGREIALGSMYTTNLFPGITPKKRVNIALMASKKLTAFVDGGIQYVEV